jgi:hypothetical protein
MVQVASSLLTAEAWFQFPANISGVCDIQSGTGTGCFRVLRCSSHMVPQIPYIHSAISDTIQSWQLTVSLNNTPQKKFKIGYLTNANPAQLLARISKVTIYRNNEILWKAKCIRVVTGLFQDRNSSLSDRQLTYCTTIRAQCM